MRVLLEQKMCTIIKNNLKTEKTKIQNNFKTYKIQILK